MVTSKQPARLEPEWWSEPHTILWEERLAQLRRDFQRRPDPERREQLATLGPDDSILQKHPTTPRNVSIEGAHAVPDDSWEVGTAWKQAEPAFRFGVGAWLQYSRYEVWDESLEALLRQDWETVNGPGTWLEMKRLVRRGFEAARGKPS